MNDSGSRRRRQAIGVNMGHYIVAHLPLPALGGFIVDVLHMLLQLLHLSGGDGQAQLMLSPGQLHPQAAPGLKTHVR